MLDGVEPQTFGECVRFQRHRPYCVPSVATRTNYTQQYNTRLTPKHKEVDKLIKAPTWVDIPMVAHLGVSHSDKEFVTCTLTLTRCRPS